MILTPHAYSTTAEVNRKRHLTFNGEIQGSFSPSHVDR